jgi:hypothetical protein
MGAWLRAVGVVLVAVAPGGLLLAAAVLLARAVMRAMADEGGPPGRRLARAVARVHARDVWRHARRRA